LVRRGALRHQLIHRIGKRRRRRHHAPAHALELGEGLVQPPRVDEIVMQQDHLRDVALLRQERAQADRCSHRGPLNSGVAFR
jgi:hypothetical protein